MVDILTGKNTLKVMGFSNIDNLPESLGDLVG